MSHFACVIVRDLKGLKKIGGDPVVNRLLAQVQEVRGVNRIIVATVPELGNRVRRAIPGEIDVVEIPDDTTARPARWLSAKDGPAHNFDIVLCVYTNAPFLTAAKMEACVWAVRSKKAQAARTVLSATVAQTGGPDHDRPGAVVVHGAIAYNNAFVGTTNWPRTFVEVPVSCVEALDVSTVEGERLAEALAFSNP